ncbi:hypothetical protein TKK_0015093 [Trichogramma kaykai]
MKNSSLAPVAASERPASSSPSLSSSSSSSSSTSSVAARSAKAAAARPRQKSSSGGGSGTWRLVITLTQSQPQRAEVQRAWEEAVEELAHSDVELAFVEARAFVPPQLKPEDTSYPTALLQKWCAELKLGRTLVSFVIGGGPAGRFLITASAGMRLPTVWMPLTHKDFIKQGQASIYESRIGTTSVEIGAAAAALMHKAHWRAFTLMIDTSLLPVTDLVGSRLHQQHESQFIRPRREGAESRQQQQQQQHRDLLTPRRIVYLPADEKTLTGRLRRVAEENGRGSVMVLACDLATAKRVIAAAGKYEMLAGRFLWLWLDLKSELRANEPNIIGQHVLQNARVSVTSDHMPASAVHDQGQEFTAAAAGPPIAGGGLQNLSPSSSDGSSAVAAADAPADVIRQTHSQLVKDSKHSSSSGGSDDGSSRGSSGAREVHWQNDILDLLRQRRSRLLLSRRRRRDSGGPSGAAGGGGPASAGIGGRASFVGAGPEDEDIDEAPGRGYERTVNSKSFMPLGMLALRPANARLGLGSADSSLGRALRESLAGLDRGLFEARGQLNRLGETQLRELFVPDCLNERVGERRVHEAKHNVSASLTRRLREAAAQVSAERSEFHLLNLQGVLFPGNKTQLKWVKVGVVRGGRTVRLDTIIWPGGGIVPAYIEQGREKIGMPSYKIVTALAPPFVMITNLQQGACLRGLVCRLGSTTRCCFGYSMDLLRHVSQDLEFRFDLHVARDGLFGRRRGRNGTWNGIIGELLSGRAQMAFAPLSVYSHRSQVVDFSAPYYFSSVSYLVSPKEHNDISLLAFLQPFSNNLWIVVFVSLNVTAFIVAVFEWNSPFGLNPWGRQRSKNFSLASALWVMWGLLCGHLVAFKAPKSWPNKFLINVWGGFSVIFVASYTANIAALIAGLFFHNTPKSYDDRSLLQQHVGAPKASAAEYYVQQANPLLWSNMARHSVPDVSSGVTRLLNGSLDVLIADTPILDYYRATDNGCRLENFGEPIKQDTYAVALSKGHPMRESISQLIANYTSTGLLDILQEKWYGGLPCIPGATLGVGYDGQPRPAGGQPRPLGVASVAGVFCLLGLGMFLGVVILIGEHIFYRYSLPKLRQCSKDSVWRSRNVMFFSQKLYRFINCVELVSPHHAARELVHTVRQGQITSLFQKSVKRKEHEQRRRRKSKAQFFEMIQEIRRAQQEERQASLIEARGAVPKKSSDASLRPGGVDPHLGARELLQCSRASRSRSRSKSPMALSPRRRAADGVQSRSSTNLTAFSIEQAMAGAAGHGSPMKPREFTLSNSNLRARSPLEVVGRRLSHGDQGESPPPTPKLGGSTTTPYGPKTPQSLAKMPQLHQQQQQQPQPQYTRVVTEPKVPQIVPPVTAIKVTPKRGESLGSAMPPPTPKQRSPTKRGQSFPVFTTLKPQMTIDTRQHYQVSQEKNRSPLLSPSELTSAIGRKLSREWGSGEELGEYFSKSHEHLGAATSSSSSHHTPRREPQQLPPRQPQQQQTTATPRPAERQSRRKRTSSQGDAERERPVRRARSHENKEHRRAATAAHFDEALLARYHQAAASHQQQQQAQSSSSSGGMSQRAKRQLESELKAILTARAHHLELHPP